MLSLSVVLLGAAILPGGRARRERPLGVGAWHGRRERQLIFNELHVSASKSTHKAETATRKMTVICVPCLRVDSQTSPLVSEVSDGGSSGCLASNGPGDVLTKVWTHPVVHPVPPCPLGFHRAPLWTSWGGKDYPAKSMDASFNLWSEIQGSQLGVQKKTLDLETEGSSVSLGSVAYELCDFGQITPPLWASGSFLCKWKGFDQIFFMIMPTYEVCLSPQYWRFLF